LNNKALALAFGLLVVAGICLCAPAADVAGTWEMTIQTPQGGERTVDMTIEQDGDTIKVTMPGFRGDEMTGEGTVTGNDIEWTFNISTQRGDFTITYTGTVDGDSMSGQAAMGDFGTMDWSAKKKSVDCQILSSVQAITAAGRVLIR
jgi:hypothetical protein